MRRVLVIVIIVLVFLGILTAIIFKVIHPSPSAPAQVAQNPFPVPTQNFSTAQSAASFTEDFYRWYLPRYTQTPPFRSSPDFAATIQNWVTPDFANSWDQIVEDSGADPVLLTQDYLNSWSKISTSIIDQTDTNAAVLIALGTGDELHRLRVNLVKTNNGWRISGVTLAQ